MNSWAEKTIFLLSGAQKSEKFFNFPMEENLILHAEWMLIRLWGPLMLAPRDVESDPKHILHEKKDSKHERIQQQEVIW